MRQLLNLEVVNVSGGNGTGDQWADDPSIALATASSVLFLFGALAGSDAGGLPGAIVGGLFGAATIPLFIGTMVLYSVGIEYIKSLKRQDPGVA